MACKTICACRRRELLEKRLLQDSQRSTVWKAESELLVDSEDVHWENQTKGTGTFAGSVANLINSAIGAGVLGLPIAFQEAGIGLATLMCLVFGVLIAYSLHIVGRAQKITNSLTYQECVSRLLGRNAEIATTILQLMYLSGACVGFLDIIPDQLLPVIQQWTPTGSVIANREFIICTVAVTVLLPLMFIQNIQKLSPLATFSVIAITYTFAMIMAHSATQLSKRIPATCFGEPKPYEGSAVSLVRTSLGIFKAVPIFCFAYNVHATYPLVFAELNAPKHLSRMDKAAGLSLFVCFFAYVCCGTFGYFYAVALPYTRVGSTSESNHGIVEGDALKMFPSAVDVTVARFCIAISVVGSYLTLHFSARTCLQDLLVKHQEGGFTARQQIYEIVTFLLGTVGVAMVLKQLDLVLDLVGSTMVIPCMFIFPGCLQLAMDGERSEVVSLQGKYNGYSMIILGVFLSITGLAVTILGQM